MLRVSYRAPSLRENLISLGTRRCSSCAWITIIQYRFAQQSMRRRIASYVILIDVALPSSSRAPFFSATATKVWRKWPVDVTHTRAEHACTRPRRCKPPTRRRCCHSLYSIPKSYYTTVATQHEKYSATGDTRRPLSTRSLTQHAFRKITARLCKNKWILLSLPTPGLDECFEDKRNQGL